VAIPAKKYIPKSKVARQMQHAVNILGINAVGN